jgi:hypothetical protein
MIRARTNHDYCCFDFWVWLQSNIDVRDHLVDTGGLDLSTGKVPLGGIFRPAGSRTHWQLGVDSGHS